MPGFVRIRGRGLVVVLAVSSSRLFLCVLLACVATWRAFTSRNLTYLNTFCSDPRKKQFLPMVSFSNEPFPLNNANNDAPIALYLY